MIKTILYDLTTYREVKAGYFNGYILMEIYLEGVPIGVDCEKGELSIFLPDSYKNNPTPLPSLKKIKKFIDDDFWENLEFLSSTDDLSNDSIAIAHVNENNELVDSKGGFYLDENMMPSLTPYQIKG